MIDLARLSQLPAQLRAEGFEAPPYRTLREAALDGAFEASQIRGLWYYRPESAPLIAKALRLTKRSKAIA